MTHDEAIEAIVGCAMAVTVLSYQEAIEGYLTLRGMTAQGMSTGTAKTPQAVEGRSPASPVAESDAPDNAVTAYPAALSTGEIPGETK